MKKAKNYEYSHAGVKQSILRQAKGLKIPQGWAEQIAEKVAKATDEWIADKELVTEDDLRRFVVSQLKELNADIAFAYHNHDKII
ncbi:hypothetical protein IJJ54_01050 [Candidatus Saccharibacteria bacterium]|nr:hypothetical protein [Candidatus Saccharibacteria bacterium]